MLTKPSKPIGYATKTKNMFLTLRIIRFQLHANRRELPEGISIDKLGLIQLLEQKVARISWAPTDARKHVHCLGATLQLDWMAATSHVAVFWEDLTVMPVRNPNRSLIRMWKRIICHHSRPNRNFPKFTREISSES